MAGFYFVSINFQFRLGIHFRQPGQQEVGVGLPHAGTISTCPNQSPAIEHTTAAASKDSTEELLTAATGDGVIDADVIVYMALIVQHERPNVDCVCAVAGEFGLQVVPDQAASQIKYPLRIAAVCCECGLAATDHHSRGRRHLITHMVQYGSLTQFQVRNDIQRSARC